MWYSKFQGNWIRGMVLYRNQKNLASLSQSIHYVIKICHVTVGTILICNANLLVTATHL